MNSFSPPISGAISDRMGRRQPLMMVGMLVAATFTMVSAFFIFPLRFGGFEFPFFLLVVSSTFQWVFLRNLTLGRTSNCPRIIFWSNS